MKHPNPQEQLESLFVDGELPSDPEALWRTLASDDRARHDFDRLAMAARALEDAPRSSMERDLGEAMFLAMLDTQLAQEQTPAPPPNNVIPLFTRPRALAILGVAAAAALASTQISWEASKPVADDAFQPRSATPSTNALPTTRAPEIQAYCVEVDKAGDVSFTGPEDAPFGVVSCPKNAELKLAYVTHDATWSYVAAFGVDAQGQVHWYGPTPVAPRAIEARRALTPAPLGESILLSVNHQPGPVRVHAVFSSEPLPYDTLKGWVQGDQDLFAPDATLTTNTPGTVTTSTTFEIVEVPR